MDLDRVKELIRLIEETDIIEIEVEKEGERIRLRREKPSVHSAPSYTPVVEHKHEEASASQWEGTKSVTITSPIVGTFFRAPVPDAEPFVDIGDEVKKGQVLCIIEAMKLMNEIECDVDGTVSQMFVENGQPVE